MVTFEDEEDPAIGSDGEDSQDEDENMDDADNMDDEGEEGDATMLDDGDGSEDDGEGDEDDDEEDVTQQQIQSQSTSNGQQSHIPLSPTSPLRNKSGLSPPAPTLFVTAPSPHPSTTVIPEPHSPSQNAPLSTSSLDDQSALIHPKICPIRPILLPREEAVKAVTYDIVPTTAAPQSTSINAISCTPDTRWVFSGGADGYVRMYDWVETANGRVPLTVAQRGPFVDSVVKSGLLTTYWENEESYTNNTTTLNGPKTPPRTHGGVVAEFGSAKETSPVYSLAVQKEALWLLSGLESGGINLQTCRHQAGTRITTLREHTSAVSVLKLDQDEKTCLSGSWDKRILEWDLNVGKVKRSFPGGGGQISAIELRPISNLPVPKTEDLDVNVESDTFSTNNHIKSGLNNGVMMNDNDLMNGMTNGNNYARSRTGSRTGEVENGLTNGLTSPDGSLFGENDHGSLFGETDDGNVNGRMFSTDDDHDHDDLFGISLNGDKHSSSTKPSEVPTTIPQDIIPPISNIDVYTNGVKLDDEMRHIKTLQAETVQDPEIVTKPILDTKLVNGRIDGIDDLFHKENPHAEEIPQSTLSTTEQDLPLSSETTFLDAAIDGTLRIWDRRAAAPTAKVSPQKGTPPWCMGACWSVDGNSFFIGRRNGCVDEYSLHKGSKMSEPIRTLRFPNGSGPVSAVRAMPNGRGLVWYVFSPLIPVF